MARKAVTRKFELFAIHFTVGDEAASYKEVLDFVSRIDPAERIQEFGNKAVVLSEVKPVAGRYQVIAFEGDKDVNPTILDLSTAQTRSAKLSRREVIAEKTHAIIDWRNRRAAVEYVRRGAKAFDIASAIEGLAKRDRRYGNLQVAFAPIPTESFLREFRRFERVREIELSVVRPNAGWSDHFTKLSGLIEDSNGGTASIAVKAGRGDSLNKRHGIAEVLIDVVSDPQPYLNNAVVKGTRKGEDVERTTSLKKHVEHRKEQMYLDENNLVPTAQAMGALGQALGDVPEKREGE